jgi:ADP-ribose pyrophosphatase YjhB (NUDIX family)
MFSRLESAVDPISSRFLSTHAYPVLSAPTHEKLRAAGTLLYALNPQGIVSVLLSKEVKWAGPSSEKWKGFGGKRDPDETLVQTAIRETKEESRNLIALNTSGIKSGMIGCTHYRCKYFQLMMPIPYQDSLPALFSAATSQDPAFLEKSEIRWFPFQRLLETIKNTDTLAMKRGCSPRKLEGPIYLKMGIERFPLAADFTETMIVIQRTVPHLLMQLSEGKALTANSVLVSDESIVFADD